VALEDMGNAGKGANVGTTPEAKVKRLVKKALDSLGPDCWRFMPVQTGFGVPALDYLLCIRGRFVAIETKAPGKKLTPMQEGTKAAMEAAGGIVLVVWDEGSLAIAMKIILALEFADNGLARSLANWAGNATPAETQRYYEQHLRHEQQDKAANAATGGDHGAPRKKSQRRAKPAAGGDDRAVTAAVTENGPPTQDPL
jgi:hypothetical protein